MGGLAPANPSLELASYLEIHLNFPNLKNDFEAHAFRILVGSFFTHFQDFQFLFLNRCDLLSF